jgi:hypothetical protein
MTIAYDGPMVRIPAFISHSFAAVPEYIGLLEMFERQGLAIVNRSVPAWAPLNAQGDELAAALEGRIRTSSRVLVLVTDQLHKRDGVRFEIEAARKYDKPIIAIYPNGHFGQPMPRDLHESLYRAIGWRGSALEKAVSGEYPPDARVFDIAEEADRRDVVRWALGAVTGATLLLAGTSQDRVAQVRSELAASGVNVPGFSKADYVVPWALGGSIAGLLVDALLGGKGGALFACAALGGALGAGLGLVHHAQVELRELGPLLELRRVE